jgi:hypothetical protein
MRHLIAPTFAALLVSQVGALASDPVVANHNTILAGQAVILNWNFTGTKVILSGGRFGAGTPVTGKTQIVDRPTKTTKYSFDVDYLGSPSGDLSVQVPLHAHYATQVEVIDPVVLGLQTYVNPHGWAINTFKKWQRDNVSMPDPANNALVYFQPEDDSVERVAVAILPIKEATSADLMKKVKADIPSRYTESEIVSENEVLHDGILAVRTVFSGKDDAHPGTKTQTVMLAFVRSGRGYIISARTAAAQFATRQRLLEALVNSFTFVEPKRQAAK